LLSNITIFLQQLNNEIDKYQDECIALQAASDIRLAGEAKDRATLNARVISGIALGGIGRGGTGGAIGGAIGALGGPLGIALGAGLGALIGGAGGGGIAHATAAKK
jgi:hypothetical protein